MSADLFRILYCSRNSILGQQGAFAVELDRILASSRVNNARSGVTGALMYNEGYFAQVLEGPLEAVQQTFERIQCDERHDEVVVLQAVDVEERLFGIWDMAMVVAGDPAATSAALARVLAQPDARAGAEVLALLAGVVSRETEQA